MRLVWLEEAKDGRGALYIKYSTEMSKKLVFRVFIPYQLGYCIL